MRTRSRQACARRGLHRPDLPRAAMRVRRALAAIGTRSAVISRAIGRGSVVSRGSFRASRDRIWLKLQAGRATAAATLGPLASGVVGAGAGIRRDWLAVIAIAALTSAGVSILTIRIGGPPGLTTAIQGRAPVPAAAPIQYAASDAAFVPEPAASETSASPPTASATTGSHAPEIARAAGSTGPSRLVVITQPAGARVTVNGVGWGDTPLTIRHLPPGDKRIRVTKPGYRGEERVVSVAAVPGARTLRIALRRAREARAAR